TAVDVQAARMARAWRRRGHRVIAVDTLPPVHTAELIPAGRVAYQVVALERQVRLQQMQAEAVELMTWSPGREWPADVAWRLISHIHPHRRLPPMATGGGR